MPLATEAGRGNNQADPILMSFQLQTPVVLLCFNRPKETARVMERIRVARPPRLHVVADAPRDGRPDDQALCDEVRKIATQIDWPCDLITDFSDQNMGCFLRVSSGLTKAFASSDELIIVEDDCVPDPSFFRFCETLLERHRGDDRVFAISGDNFQTGASRTPYSYYFSQIFHCWGWASWRQQWQSVDLSMSAWPELRDGNWLSDALGDPDAVAYYRLAFEQTYTRKNNSWAYRAALSSMAQGKVNILPSVNLVQNIGFGTDATHTGVSPAHNAPGAASIKFPLSHPPYMIVDRQADRATFARMNGGGSALKRLAKGTLRRLNIDIRRATA